MFYVITESCAQIDDGSFETRREAEDWIAASSNPGTRYFVLSDAEMAEMEAAAN